jgi:hypothetical protein
VKQHRQQHANATDFESDTPVRLAVTHQPRNRLRYRRPDLSLARVVLSWVPPPVTQHRRRPSGGCARAAAPTSPARGDHHDPDAA